ncbi:hypothetical protein BJ165DRAFT_1406142 [Panaeolus papilionaceus]|nr:hypothetical protein BJ165DRAFT_1406142 [Panaeolus papilionaceus]
MAFLNYIIFAASAIAYVFATGTPACPGNYNNHESRDITQPPSACSGIGYFYYWMNGRSLTTAANGTYSNGAGGQYTMIWPADDEYLGGFFTRTLDFKDWITVPPDGTLNGSYQENNTLNRQSKVQDYMIQTALAFHYANMLRHGDYRYYSRFRPLLHTTSMFLEAEYTIEFATITRLYEVKGPQLLDPEFRWQWRRLSAPAFPQSKIQAQRGHKFNSECHIIEIRLQMSHLRSRVRGFISNRKCRVFKMKCPTFSPDINFPYGIVSSSNPVLHDAAQFIMVNITK